MTRQFYLAPIRGITDQSFRNAYARHFPGFHRAIAPFISVGQGRRVRPSVLSDLLPDTETGIPTVPQLLTNSATELVQVASALFDMGHSSVNWNLGCPFPTVTNKKKGAGLLPHPEMIEECLDKSVPRLQGNLSIKIRLGFDRADEIARLLPIFNRYPLEEIVIHPRTAIQMYSGEVDLDGFASCLDISKHRLVYNGDITSATGFAELEKRFPTIRHWMIGREALHDPFLIRAIDSAPPRPLPERLELLQQFHDELFEIYSAKFSGPAHLLDRMKAVWAYLISCFDNDGKILKKIRKTTSVARYQSIVRDVFLGAHG